MLRSEQFANQLSLLHEDWPAENIKVRDYISKWLMTLLTDEKSQRASIDEFPVITKKLRDEALGKMDKNFFHRSNYYMAVKVMLQHNLTMQFDAQLGKFVYKIVMLNFLIELCAIYQEPDCGEFDIDLMSQMIAKMARRIDKLSQNEQIATMPKDIAKLYDYVISQAKFTIESIRYLIDTHIEEIQNEDTQLAQLLPINGFNFDADICYKMPKLAKYLRDQTNEMPHIQSRSKRLTKSYRRSYKQGNRHQTKIEITDESIFWTDFENGILYEMGDDDEFFIYEDGGRGQM